MNGEAMHIVESSLLSLYQKHISRDQSDSDPLYIAYSGGLDSTVLLFAGYQLAKKCLIPQVKALHVNHGIEEDSDQWQSHCEDFCNNLSIEINSTQLNLRERTDSTSENNARIARYDFFKRENKENSLVAFGHHQDDQVETLLFRLFRGTGISGAAAIPECRTLGQGIIIRPFLKIKKSELLKYAQLNRLHWVEDSSNSENQYSRNIIRNKILPLIQLHWPQVIESLSHFSKIAEEQNEILIDVAKNDLKNVSFAANQPTEPKQICLRKFLVLTSARQKNLIYHWVANFDTVNFSKPSSLEIKELLRQLAKAIKTSDVGDSSLSSLSFSSKLNLKLGGYRVRIYDNKLWLSELEQPIKLKETFIWNNLEDPIEIFEGTPYGLLACRKESINALTVRSPNINEVVTVRFRTGGEKVKPHYRDRSCDLKKIYQELKVPHWKRDWQPIIYYNDELVAVVGIFVSKKFVAKKSEQKIEFNFSHKPINT